MGAQLNIKDAETIELARDLAKQLGKTVTEIVREAIREKAQARETEQAEQRKRIDAILAEIHANLPDEVRGKTSKEIMDSIYDDDEPDGFAR